MPVEPKVMSFSEWLALQGDKYDVCPECNGTGDNPHPESEYGYDKTCDLCKGTGGAGIPQARKDYRQAVMVHRLAWKRWNQQARP